MARYRTLVWLSRALRATAVIVAAAAGTTVLFQADLGRGLVMPSWKVATAPPVLYLTIALVALRQLPLDRKIGWALAACGVNLALGLVSAITLSLAYPMSLEGALTRTLWTYVPGPIISLVAAPLVLLGWRSRVVPLRASRLGRAQRRAMSAIMDFPEPALAVGTPDWDAVLRPSTVPARGAGGGPKPFERAGGAAVLEIPEDALVAPPPPASFHVPSATDIPVTMPPVPAPPRATASAVREPSGFAPSPRPEAEASREAAAVADGPVIRVPLLRVAAQLPPDVFVLPPARLAESLREPHVLVVPQRLVVPQLGEGAVEIAWTLVEDQFPELALAMPASEVRRRFPGWVISLPMDEVLRQIPADLIRVTTPAADLSSLAGFPPPFIPGPPAPLAPPTSADGTPAPPAGVQAPAVATPVAAPPAPLPVAAPPAPAPVAAPPAVPAPTVAAPAVVAPLAAAPPAAAAPVVAPPVAAPLAAAAPVVAPPAAAPPAAAAPVAAPPAATASPAVPVPAAAAPASPEPRSTAPPPTTRSRADSTPAPSVAVAPEADAVDQESEALARTLAVGLTALGAFEWQTRRVAGRSLVSFVAPALAREAIDEMAAAGAVLVQRLAAWGAEQMTIRTSRLACVLTPLGTRGCLAATVRRNGPVAMLELVSARAARSAGIAPAVAVAGGALPSVATSAAGADQQRRLGEAARALGAFGPVNATVAPPDGHAPRVYVFADRDRGVLAGVARVVHAALAARHDHDALGRLDTVELRRGRERVVVRPLRESAGTPAVLVALGEVTLAGRAHRAVARAAALLEAR